MNPYEKIDNEKALLKAFIENRLRVLVDTGENIRKEVLQLKKWMLLYCESRFAAPEIDWTPYDIKQIAVRIRIGYSEHPQHQRRYSEKRPAVFEGVRCWENAQLYLNSLAETSPMAGYNKTGIYVDFENGHTYEARLDLQHPDSPNRDNDIAEHIRHFCFFYGGLLQEHQLPKHLTMAAYKVILDRHDTTYPATFLEKYDVPS